MTKATVIERVESAMEDESLPALLRRLADEVERIRADGYELPSTPSIYRHRWPDPPFYSVTIKAEREQR